MKEKECGSRPKAILTCFAGRQRNMEILLMYADELHARGLIEQMHIWDFSRNDKDGEWLSRTFQPSPYVQTQGYEYRAAGAPVGQGERREVMFRCGEGAHLLLSDADKAQVAEVSLGAYWNSCDFLRDGKQGNTLDAHGGRTCDPNRWRRVGVAADEDGVVSVEVDGEKILSGGTGRRPRFPLELSLAGWGGCDAIHWRLDDEDRVGFLHPYARLFHVRNKGSWREYYQHYTSQLYPGRVIIKSDDDIVFIDTESFGRFLDRRAMDHRSLLMFPSIVNNGLCAFHQQSLGYMDEGLGRFPHEGAMGRLWGDGKLCLNLHRRFCGGYEGWVGRARSDENVIRMGIGERISINFFAIRSEDLHAFQMVGQDDERELTMEITRKLNRHNSISMGMTVAHLAFYRQRDTGMDEAEALGLYRRLADKTLVMPRLKIL